MLKTTAYVWGKIPEQGFCLTSLLLLWRKVLGDSHATELEVKRQRRSEAETVLIVHTQPPPTVFWLWLSWGRGNNQKFPCASNGISKESNGEPVSFLWEWRAEDWGDPKQAFLNNQPKPRSFRRCGYDAEDLWSQQALRWGQVYHKGLLGSHNTRNIDHKFFSCRDRCQQDVQWPGDTEKQPQH